MCDRLAGKARIVVSERLRSIARVEVNWDRPVALVDMLSREHTDWLSSLREPLHCLSIPPRERSLSSLGLFEPARLPGSRTG